MRAASQRDSAKKHQEQKRNITEESLHMVHGKVPVCVLVDVSTKQMLSDSNTERVTARKKRSRAQILLARACFFFLCKSVPSKHRGENTQQSYAQVLQLCCCTWERRWSFNNSASRRRTDAVALRLVSQRCRRAVQTKPHLSDSEREGAALQGGFIKPVQKRVYDWTRTGAATSASLYTFLSQRGEKCFTGAETLQGGR